MERLKNEIAVSQPVDSSPNSIQSMAKSFEGVLAEMKACNSVPVQIVQSAEAAMLKLYQDVNYVAKQATIDDQNGSAEAPARAMETTVGNGDISPPVKKRSASASPQGRSELTRPKQSETSAGQQTTEATATMIPALAAKGKQGKGKGDTADKA